jgi:HEAT repeat protein
MTTDEDASALAFSLGQMNNAKAYDALAGMARDKTKTEKLRLSAVQAIGEARLANRITMLDDIYKANMDTPRIRRAVVNALTRSREPQVVDVLLRIAQNDPDLQVRREAVMYIGQQRTPEALKALETLLTKKPQ